MFEILHQKALACAKNYKKSEAELIAILTEIDHNRAYLSFGVSSLIRYCIEKLGLDPAESNRFIQVTRKSRQVPELREAIESGTLTVSKASRIAPVIRSESSEVWIQKAVDLKFRDLEREVARENPKAVRREKITVLTPELNEIRFCVTNVVEEKFKRVREVLGTKSIEDTFEQMADLALYYKDPIKKAERARAKFPNLAEKTQPSAPPKSQMPSKPATWRVVAKEISRAVPASVRHQVFLRDRGKCTFKGCNETKWIQIHHIKPFSYGGAHELSNLTTLCSSHHSALHEPKSRNSRTP